MPNLFGEFGLFVLVPVLATIVGGVYAAFRPPGPRLRSALQHLAAGVVFAAVASELIPEIAAEDQPLPEVGTSCWRSSPGSPCSRSSGSCSCP